LKISDEGKNLRYSQSYRPELRPREAENNNRTRKNAKQGAGARKTHRRSKEYHPAPKTTAQSKKAAKNKRLQICSSTEQNEIKQKGAFFAVCWVFLC